MSSFGDSPRALEFSAQVEEDELEVEVEDKNKKCERKWKHFTGNNRFYCGGRVMTAPSIRYFLFCCALIIFTVALFMVFE